MLFHFVLYYLAAGAAGLAASFLAGAGAAFLASALAGAAGVAGASAAIATEANANDTANNNAFIYYISLTLIKKMPCEHTNIYTTTF